VSSSIPRPVSSQGGDLTQIRARRALRPAECGIIGTALGLGLAGQRAVAEIQFCDYVFNTIDLLKLVGSTSWSTMGSTMCPSWS